MGFEDVKSIFIDNKEVQSIIVKETGAILFEKSEAPTEINPILQMGYTKVGQRIYLEVVDSTNGDIVEDANYMLRGAITPTQGLPSNVSAEITNGVGYLSAPDGDCFIKLGNEEQGISKEVFFLYQDPVEGLSRVIDITKTIEIVIDGTDFTKPLSAYSPRFIGDDIIITCDGEFITHSDSDTEFTYSFDVSGEHHIVMYNVNELSSAALDGLSEVTQINLYEGIDTLNGSCFSQTKITEINIPKSVSHMESHVFTSCDSLTSVILNWTNQDDIIPFDLFRRGMSTLPIFTVPTGTKQLYITAGYPSDRIYEESLKFTFSGTTLTQYSSGSFDGEDMIIDYGDGTVESTNGRFGHTYSKNGTYQVKIYGVTSLEEYCFRNCSGLTSITLPNNIISIGARCFYGCNDLNSITLPNGITHLEDQCFRYCIGLTSINIPNSVTNIGNGCFDGCIGLTSIILPDSIISLGSSCFYGCNGLTSITLSNNITSLGSSCFYGCNGLTSIIIPSGVTSLGTSCFSDCKGLTSITLPDSVLSIGGYCFYKCTGLTSITLPNGISSLGDDCFYNCTSLTSIVIPSGVTSLGTSCFHNCTGLTSITLPNSITNLGNNCFYNCTGLTSIILPNSVTSLGSSCFYGCNGLTSITLSNSISSLKSNCFYNCTGLTSIILPNGISSLENYCFNGCTGLTSIVIPDSVADLDAYCFSGCTGLSSIYLNWTGTNILSYNPMWMANTSTSKFYIPRETQQLYIDNGYPDDTIEEQPMTLTVTGSSFETFVSAPFAYTGKLLVDWGDGNVVEYPEYLREKLSHSFSDGLSSHTIRVYGDLSSITSSCFEGCTNLTSIIIPNGVIQLERFCFKGCTNLTLVIVPNSVISVGENCFRDCNNLTSITLPDDISSFETSCFRNCNNLTSITLPNNISSLGNYCFDGCTNLTSINIPNNVLSLGNNCFRNCISLNDYYLNWVSSSTIIAYDSNKMPNNTNTIFHIPTETGQLYIDKGYPNNKLEEA